MSELTRSNNPIRFAPLILAACLMLCTSAGLQAQVIPFYEEDPFDRITLDATNAKRVLIVRPLDFPERRIPENMRADAKIIVRLVEEPDKKYELTWYSIDKIELFEQMVLDKANQLILVGKLDEAYDYLVFLLQKEHKPIGLDRSWQELLFADAKDAFRREQFDRALAMLRELHDRAPGRPGLDAVLGATTERLVEKYLADENYPAVRQLVGQLAEQYPAHAVVAARQAELMKLASAALEKAKAAGRQSDWAEAADACRRAIQIWPALPGLRETAKAVHDRYPRVVIGVGQLAVEPDPTRLTDRPARRSGRLLYRMLTEFAGPGVDGGHYACPIGELTLDMLEQNMILDIRPGIRFAPDEPELAAYDVSRVFLEMADRRRSVFRPDWGALLASVTVTGPLQVETRLVRTHVRPDALLSTVFAGEPTGGRSLPAPNGPFRIASRTEAEVVYLAAADYFDAADSQTREIVERHFDDSGKAVRALKRGEIDFLERVPAWRLDAIRGDNSLVIGTYAVPRVHCLIPNLAKTPTSNRTFRRALVYGIHREAILDRLSGGGAIAGCRVLSGPFPAGVTAADPLGYAYDADVQPRGYNPRMAIALGAAGLKEIETRLGEGAKIERPARLVLAHPPGEIPRMACIDIRRQLQLLGLAIELRPLEAGMPERIPDDVDLMYVELALWEPVVDARRLLGNQGPSGRANPYIRLALRRLDEAGSWEQAIARLQQIHRLAHDDVSVVPLWQLGDQFAHRKGLQAVGNEPVTLYQHVERWQPTFEYPTDEP